MKKAILMVLIVAPLVLTIYRPLPPKPPFDRQANEVRVWEIKEIICEAEARTKPMGRLPSPYPKGYPSDPDSGSWEGQQ